jgi:hypothetical protein
MPDHIWSEAEKDYIRRNSELMSDAAIAAELSRITGEPITKIKVLEARKRMGLKKCENGTPRRPKY